MSIEGLKGNLQQAGKIIKDIIILDGELSSVETIDEKNFFDSAIESLLTQLKLVNKSIVPLLISIGLRGEKKIDRKIGSMFPIRGGLVILNRKDRKRFMQELDITEEMLKKIRRGKKQKKIKKIDPYKQANQFVTIASRIFSKRSFRLAESTFQSLNKRIKKANMSLLLSTYISIMLFSTLLVFLISLPLAVIFSFIKITMEVGRPYPLIALIEPAGIAMRLTKNIALSFLAPAITFLLFYLYPFNQASSIRKRIDSELPFAVIHMSSIAGSGVEPSRVFNILALSKEYPVVSKEFKKIMNQVNLYGYDLVNALRNISKSTSSEKLAELLNGISTNISGGGSLQHYLDKKAEEILLDYKLERRKYSAIAETSMDIYIGILVAAPLIFMVLLILMNVTGIGFGVSMQAMTYLIIAGIAVLNIFFLLFIQFKQPV